MITVDVDTSGLEEKIIRLAKFTRKSVGEVMRQEGRLLAVQLARYTQPFGFSDKSKQQGQSAIAGDLVGTRRTGRATGGQGDGTGGVFTVVPDDIMAKAVDYKDGTTRLFVKKDGTVYGADTSMVLKNPSMAQLDAIHQSKRRASDGSVTQAGYGTKDIGRWKFVSKFVISKSVFQNYLAYVFTKVGIAKSGWADCAKKLGGTRGGTAEGNIPGWVTRHLKDFSFGVVGDETDNPENPKLFLINEVNYTSQVLSESGKRGAVRDTEVRLAKSIQLALDHPPK